MNYHVNAVFEKIDNEQYNCLTPQELAFVFDTKEYENGYVPERFDNPEFSESWLSNLSNEQLAFYIREIPEWIPDFNRELCYRADLISKFVYLEDWESVVYEAAKKLGVDITPDDRSNEEIAADIRKSEDEDSCRALCFRADMTNEEYLTAYDEAEDDQGRAEVLRDVSDVLHVDVD